MNLGSTMMGLVPKSIRRTLRESLSIVLREELEGILREEFDKINRSRVSNPRLVARELGALLEQQMLPYRSEPDSARGSDSQMQPMSSKDIYAPPQTVTDLDECHFYHSMDIPGYGYVEGEWDLRGHEDEYLGGVDLQGKRVLEVGTASGFLCFYMESQGAEVVAHDLAVEGEWDIVPFSGYDYQQRILDAKTHVGRIHNGYWLCHRAHNSQAKVVYGTTYDIPEEIGLVDVSVVSSVLLHLRDPFLALQNALRLTAETVVIAEMLPTQPQLTGPHMRFMPDFNTCEPKALWWVFSPDIIKRFIGVLGFEDAEVKYHSPMFKRNNAQVPYYTVVGHRTKSIR